MKSFLPIFIVMFSYFVSSADDEKKPDSTTTQGFEGLKAGDRKELVPGIFFRWCPAGTFTMGEDDEQVEIKLSTGFWLGETEVTQGYLESVYCRSGFRSYFSPGRRNFNLGFRLAAVPE